MDANQKNDNFPWELIVSALQGDQTPDETALFREWLAQDQRNADHFRQLQQMWREGLSDYSLYQEADETRGWENLQREIGRSVQLASRPRSRHIGRWAAIAALFLLLAGIGWWFAGGHNQPRLYETAREQQKLTLPDGSMVTIEPQTRFRVSSAFNQANRTVILESGSAEFTVAHGAQSTFTVDLDVASVRDIGTVFSVQRTRDSIQVKVSSGKIAIIQKATGESRQVGAGGSVVFYPDERRFGEVQPAAVSGDAMRFHDSPLSGVIAVLEGAFGKKIALGDSTLGRKRLTADLNGVGFADAIKIVCASLNLDCTDMNGGYLLKDLDSATLKH